MACARYSSCVGRGRSGPPPPGSRRSVARRCSGGVRVRMTIDRLRWARSIGSTTSPIARCTPRRGKAEPFGDHRDRLTGTPPLADLLRALLMISASRARRAAITSVSSGPPRSRDDLVHPLAGDPVALADLAKRPACRSELEHLPARGPKVDGGSRAAPSARSAHVRALAARMKALSSFFFCASVADESEITLFIRLRTVK